MAGFTCPYCINSYNVRDILRVCPDCGEPARPSIFEWISGKVKCKKSGCGKIANVRRCPKCGHNIPIDATVTRNLPFSIVGVSNSGKTNYITVMLHELGRASILRLALSAQDSETRSHQSLNKKQIYDLHRMPESTAAGEALAQIWRIKNLAKQTQDRVPTYTFTIFDGAGEDHENMDPDSPLCRYIAASKAIVLTVDPLILENIKNSGTVDKRVLINSLAGSKDSGSSAETVINNVAQYLKSASGTDPEHKLKIPVAVVLTKFDTVINHPALPQSAFVRQNSSWHSTGRTDENEYAYINKEIRSWLESIGEFPFLNAIEANFTEYCFFAVSSFGEPPLEGKRLRPIHPHRVLDPILWLFHKNGFID